MELNKIRNFCIIAHVDHGKSTLADRILETTHSIPKRDMREQVLDDMDLERERGITIKAHAIQSKYKSPDGNEYTLNLIDTPGHVDFTYEVSRSLKACEGAILVVDAVQGVEAQTLANAYLAIDSGLDIVPVINKIDLPNARVEEVKKQIKEIIGIDSDDVILASAKEGTGIQEILEAVVKRIRPPSGSSESPLRALVFDSFYDHYLGVVTIIRVFDGTIRKNMGITMMSNKSNYEVFDVGILKLDMVPVNELSAGDVGFMVAGIREIRDVKGGDTITETSNQASEPLIGFRELQPMVFCGLYPTNGDEYNSLREALEKLKLNDASFVYEPESSPALSFGFRCGFLGTLHMEIVQERLEREYGLSLITTAPSVRYKAIKTDGKIVEVDNPSKLPKLTEIDHIEEPFITAEIMLPSEYVGSIMELCQSKRGIFKSIHYLSSSKVLLNYEIPLAEIVMEFYDRLKSLTRGYGSMDYDIGEYRESNLVKLDILIHGNPVDALSTITHREKAYERGKALVEKLREIIPRQLFEVPIQATIGGKVIARENIKPLRKDVIAKLYGGDVTRKNKLLDKQKVGKKRMKQIGKVDIPQEAFMAVLSLE
ncbi:MAG: GTP-binding protein LepA [Candidatus Poribacteria bacterium]|nr:GTP-binding protein LepA [Candidatus Poribacteria bacterium]